ncbi:MAG: cyclopropane-fatty-acyl-phospholipid synthase family protein [Rhodoferax sp.]
MTVLTSSSADHAVLRSVDVPRSARAVLALLQRLPHGSLSLVCPDGQVLRFGPDPRPHASLTLHSWAPLQAAMRSGDIGFAEGYIDGQWSTPNLVELLQLLARNRNALEHVIYGRWLGRLAYVLRHWRHRNTRTNSAKNIHAHYDLGNAFYRLWLDETMNYSSALFQGDLTQPLAQAQRAKVQRALQAAGVKAGHRVLEIGCGWGALAEQATAIWGARVTGITLSTEQLAYAQARLARLGREADLRLQDYRDVTDAPFDAICSIEMVEAVGQAFWPTYFRTVARLLKPGGRACVQSIVIDDALFARYLKGSDFIQQYVFPGGCLPSPSAFRAQARAAGLNVIDEFAFGCDYAETLRRWHEGFRAQQDAVLALGFDERFIRTWEFYLAYCQAAFLERNIDVVQFTLHKPT